MSNIYYTSLTGMLAASYGLQNASHNISNMQSPGFKRGDVVYSSLSDGKNHSRLGSGVTVAGITTNFSAGNYLQTGNPTDLAIVGQEFFIIRLKNGELRYTRDGEFIFKDGMLIDKRSGGLVQGLDKQQNLASIHEVAAKKHIGKATRSIDLAGEFILIEKKEQGNIDPDPFKSNYETIQFSVTQIFDEKGRSHKVDLEFKPKGSVSNQQKNWDGLEWELVKLSYDDLDLAFEPQSLHFSDQMNGAALDGANLINLKLPNNQLVSLKFGDYMMDQDKSVRLNKADLSKANSNITVYKQDGYGEGQPISFSFDDNGQISYLYDNGQSEAGVYIALAKFADPEQSLIPVNDNLFRTKTEHGRQIGRANKDGFARLQPQHIESSNVDSTTEFANIIVLQRMFQACSQVMEIDKQLLEELYKK